MPRQSPMEPQTADLVILCIGRTDRSEFRETLPTLKSMGLVIAAPDVDSVLAELARRELVPDVSIIAQSFPGEFPDSQLDSLRQAAPLVRMVALLGSWCEGEMRTGSPWPGTDRVYWHQWAPHCHRELTRLIAGHESTWSLPATASDEERCLTIAARPEAVGIGAVEIVTDQFDVYTWLAAACQHRGYQPHWRRRRDEPGEKSPAAVLLDGCGEPFETRQRIRELRRGHDSPIVVLADFPRIADRDRYVAAGARAVLSRPFFWDDLFWYFSSPPE